MTPLVVRISQKTMKVPLCQIPRLIQATGNWNYNLAALITVSHLLDSLTVFLIRPGQVDQYGLRTNTKISVK